MPIPAAPIGRANVDTFIVVGGNGTREALSDEALVRAIKTAPSRARRVASVCSGAFLLAQAGLLEGRRATTHWRRAAQFAQMFPNVRLEADCIDVKDGTVWTSAGVTTGIDLALAMIAEDLGEEIAANVAREMVVYAKRPGGQAQHSALLDLDSGASRFAPLNAWIREHLDADLSVERLAEQAAMSPRNFARAYAAETGAGKCDKPPAEWFARSRFSSDATHKRYLQIHLIPDEPELWKLERYDDFVAARKALITSKFAYMLRKDEEVLA